MADQSAAALAAFSDTWNDRLQDPFVELYARLSEAAWEERLLASIAQPVLDGIAFPKYPPPRFQERIHGHAGVHSMREAFAFYLAVSQLASAFRPPIDYHTRVLDFGAGWGRIIRPFMARVALKNLAAFEPNLQFAGVARMLNPYVATVSGDYLPPSPFAEGRFEIIVAWSVFTHFPAMLARDWLAELGRILAPNGMIFLTTWGGRFVETLLRDQQKAVSGREIHWFHRDVIDRAGDLLAVSRRHRAGEIVFIPSQSDPNYGDTFMSARAARQIAPAGLEFVAYNETSLAQDLIAFRKLPQ